MKSLVTTFIFCSFVYFEQKLIPLYKREGQRLIPSWFNFACMKDVLNIYMKAFEMKRNLLAKNFRTQSISA